MKPERTSPTERTLALYRKQGWQCAVVEKWNPYAKVRNDAFGFIDILAYHPFKKKIIGIQTTTMANKSNRIKKMAASQHTAGWNAAGGEIHLVVWRKLVSGWDADVLLFPYFLQKQTGEWVGSSEFGGSHGEIGRAHV